MDTDRFVVPAPAGYLLVTVIGKKLDVALEGPIVAFSYAVERRSGRPDHWTIIPFTLEGPPRRDDTWAVKSPDGKVQEISRSWDRFHSTKEFLTKSDTLRRARGEMAPIAFGNPSTSTWRERSSWPTWWLRRGRRSFATDVHEMFQAMKGTHEGLDLPRHPQAGR